MKTLATYLYKPYVLNAVPESTDFAVRTPAGFRKPVVIRSPNAA
jgi:hypothetical protein